MKEVRGRGTYCHPTKTRPAFERSRRKEPIATTTHPPISPIRALYYWKVFQVLSSSAEIIEAGDTTRAFQFAHLSLTANIMAETILQMEYMLIIWSERRNTTSAEPSLYCFLKSELHKGWKVLRHMRYTSASPSSKKIVRKIFTSHSANGVQ